jgi:biopolymer transport protein ExbD
MRFRRNAELEHGLKAIDIVPLINIVFLLIIFFMLTSSFVIQPGIKVNLPKAITSEAVKYENAQIIISSENIIYFNDQAISTQELETLLKQVAKNKQGVLIKADKHASLGMAVEIWDMCRDLGVTQINIATNQE